MRWEQLDGVLLERPQQQRVSDSTPRDHVDLTAEDRRELVPKPHECPEVVDVSVHEIHQDVDIAARRVEVGTRRRSDDRERRHRMPRARRTDLGRVIGYGLREMVGVVAHAIHLHDDGWSGRTQQKAIGPGEPGPI
jgi:hypothetical protein